MNNSVLSISLLLVGALPLGVRLFNLLLDGGLQYPMIWTNEATLWGCIFSVFPLLGVYFSYKSKGHKDRNFYTTLFFALIIVFPSFYDLVFTGINKIGDRQIVRPGKVV